MIVHHREGADRHMSSRKFALAALDPISAITRSVALATQERATHTACDAVIPADYRGIDEMCAGHGRGGSCSGWHGLREMVSWVEIALHLLAISQKRIAMHADFVTSNRGGEACNRV